MPSNDNLQLTQRFYQVNEQFTSIQGEGVLTGSPAHFIRLQGCTVGCEWCDSGPLADELDKRNTNGETKNTWGKGGKRMTPEDILAQVDTHHVVITGGEPTIWNLDTLIGSLRYFGAFVQLETSGQNALKGEFMPSWVTWSPKQRLGFTGAQQLVTYASEVKWVVDDELTDEIVNERWMDYLRLCDQGILQAPPYFVLMPEGSPPSTEHRQKALSMLERLRPRSPIYALHWRYLDRLQYTLAIR